MRIEPPPTTPPRTQTAAPSKAEAMMHPVRLRIVNALQGRELSPREIGAVLPDVPQATLYRHVSHLQKAGIIRVSGERPAGGTVERTYAVVDAETRLRDEDIAAASRDEFGGYVRAFVGMLLAAFDRYVRQKAPLRPREDGVAFYAKAVHLTDDEYRRLGKEVVDLFAEAQKKGPGEGRRRRTVAFLCAPDPQDKEE